MWIDLNEFLGIDEFDGVPVKKNWHPQNPRDCPDVPGKKKFEQSIFISTRLLDKKRNPGLEEMFSLLSDNFKRIQKKSHDMELKWYWGCSLIDGRYQIGWYAEAPKGKE